MHMVKLPPSTNVTITPNGLYGYTTLASAQLAVSVNETLLDGCVSFLVKPVRSRFLIRIVSPM